MVKKFKNMKYMKERTKLGKSGIYFLKIKESLC